MERSITSQTDIKSGFINDIDGGLPFWPRLLHENTLINFYEAAQIIGHFKANPQSGTYSEEFIKLTKGLKPDNPVLVITD